MRLLEEDKVAFSVGGSTTQPAHSISQSAFNQYALAKCYGKQILKNKAVQMGKASCSGECTINANLQHVLALTLHFCIFCDGATCASASILLKHRGRHC